MSDNLGFYFNDIARLMRKRFDMAARNIGVTGPQWRVLLVVLRNPGINQGQLADRLDVEPITTCRMVDRLELAGLVERRRDPADRRAWRIFLTDAALPLVGQLREIGEEMVAQATCDLSEGERAAMTTQLERIRERLLDNAAFQVKEAENG